MFRFRSKKRRGYRGFTLLEAIIYIGLSGVVLVAVTLFSLEFTLTKSKSTALARANRYVQFASARIAYEIRAADGINYASSVFDANPGTISLETADAGTNPTVISVSGNALVIQQGAGDPVALTPADLEVSNFTVEDVADENSSRSIRYSLNLAYVNPDSLEFSDADASVSTSVRSWRDDGFGAGAGTPPTLSWIETTDVDFNDGTFSLALVSGSDSSATVELDRDATWTEVSSPTGNHINELDGVAEDDIWGALDGGDMIHWDGTTWWVVPTTAPDHIRDLQMLTATDGFAAGKNGWLGRWDGSSWSSLTSPTSDEFKSLSMVSSSFGVAVGQNGKIAHWNGSAWSLASSPTSDELRGVDMLSATDGFAAGKDGEILRWNGAAWSDMGAPATGDDYRAVTALSADMAWAVGQNGRIMYWDGSSWAQQTSPTSEEIRNVEAVSANEVWAVAKDGEILKWDGSSWSLQSSPTGNSLRGLAVGSTTGYWICGDGGVLIEGSFDYFASGNYISSVFDSASDGTAFGIMSWGETLPANTDLTIATRSGDVATPDVTWSDWSAELTDNSGSAVTSPDARYIQYRASLSTTDDSVTSELNDITITYTQ